MTSCNTQNSSVSKKIAVLNSGGDSPGMSAAVRAVVVYARKLGYEVLGVREGYKGLLSRDTVLLHDNDVDDFISRGGTKLYSARCPEFNSPEGLQKASDYCREIGVVGIITIGGDGTLRGASDLVRFHGIPCVGFPGTIDNDFTPSDESIGFDTAVNTTIHMIDNLRDTCNAHRRCNVVECMGRAAGDIALHAAIAVGAQAVLLKEVDDHSMEKVAQILDEQRKDGRRDFIVLVSEGIPLDLTVGGDFSEKLKKYIEYNTGDIVPEIEEARKNDPEKKILRPDYIETKFVRPAHIVRGGSPTKRDRMLAAEMAYHAVNLLHQGISLRAVCLQNGKITDIDIDEALLIDRMYKDILNSPYAESGRLNEATMKSFEKNRQRLKEGLSQKNPDGTPRYPAEKQAQMRAFCENKLSSFRELYKTAYNLNR